MITNLSPRAFLWIWMHSSNTLFNILSFFFGFHYRILWYYNYKHHKYILFNFIDLKKYLHWIFLLILVKIVIVSFTSWIAVSWVMGNGFVLWYYHILIFLFCIFHFYNVDQVLCRVYDNRTYVLVCHRWINCIL